MIKVKDGYAKLIGTTYSGSASRLLLSDGGDKAVSDFAASSHNHPYAGASSAGGTANAAYEWKEVLLSNGVSLADYYSPGNIYYAGGSNSITDLPEGVDAFGMYNIRCASGWFGQILLSSNRAQGLYYRAGTTTGYTNGLNWKTLLDSSNSSVSKSGQTLTVKINGVEQSLTNSTYNFSGVSFTSGNQNTGEHNCNNIKSNGVWYYTSNGPTTTLGATTNDGALYTQAYSTSWVAQIAQDYRNGNLFTRGLNNGTWSSWKKVAYSDDIVKNTAGSTDTSSKIFLIGATSQAANPQTYSHDTVYVGTDGYLYSNKEKVDMRLTTSLVPLGTAIPANANLNTTEYLKVGKYYCSANVTAATLVNCPIDKAFMMEVYSPLSTTIDNENTSAYVYRLRKITHYNTGVQYIQYVGSGSTAGSFTYNNWYVVPRSLFTLDTADNNGGSAARGSTTQGVYVDSTGTLQAMTYTLGKSVPSDAKFTDTNYYHTRAHSSGLKISTGTGVSDMYVPEGTTSSLGVVKQHKAENCTSYTSDDGATTPAAVKKAVGMFGVLSGYGTCSTAAATAAKVVSIADTNWRLVTGCIIGVKFTNSNSASSVTLNVNSTGAKNIWYNNAKYTGTSTSICGYQNRVIYYMYDGTYWVWLNMGSLDGNNYAYVRQYQTDSTNEEYPLLFRYETSDPDSYVTKYTRYDSAITVNPSTNTIKATTFNGNLTGNAATATNANGLSSTGYGNGNLTYYQTSSEFYGNSGWSHYIIANHGNGETYYNYTIALPFWDVPKYKRLEGGTSDGWHTFITSENISSQSVAYAASAGSATKLATARTISLTGSVTGSGSFDGSGNLSIATTTNHTHSYVPYGAVVFTPANTELTNSEVLSLTGAWSMKKGTWNYAGNGYIVAGDFGNIDLAGTSVLTFGNSSAYTQLFITAPKESGHSGKTNEMFFYNDHGSDYSPGWTRVLTDRNYESYVNTTNFPGLNKTGTVTSVATGTGLTGGTINSTGTISINSTYLTYISNGNTAYGWGNHADVGYLEDHQTIYSLKINNSAGTTQVTYTPNSAAKSINLTKAMVGLGNVDNTADANKTVAVANKLGTATKGSATKPIYLSSGSATACDTYAGGTAVTLNGTSKAASTASFYAPTSEGTSGYVLKSSGSEAPSWVAQSTLSVGTAAKLGTETIGGSTTPIYLNSGIPKACTYSLNATVSSGTSGKLAYYSGTNAVSSYTSTKGSSNKPIYLNSGTATECSTYAGGTAVTLNGTSKAASTATFYAPTSAGTSGYLLESNGSGAPTWTNIIGSSTTSLSASYIKDMYADALYIKSYWTSSGDIYISGFTTAPDSDSRVRLYTARYAIIKNNSSSSNCAIYAPGGFYESSDERLKCILNPIKVDLDAISKLRKIYYTWKDESNGSRQLGVIAQDVQDLYPELVDVNKDTGYLSLAYDKLSVLALEAIDVLYKEHKKLKERVDELEKLLTNRGIL